MKTNINFAEQNWSQTRTDSRDSHLEFPFIKISLHNELNLRSTCLLNNYLLVD
ncbi:hypothetical protein BpHYR1_003941 [Brachionus plicatilis]|uniref:Uncharacterized protein n=1 Tax=Brachionus plicatilis TaxID=10195 RepID=A0A3M7P4Y2_BRAPC|nr:hypothetical protein BpHYR1_003941 [Brachionus plicatilis]